MDELINKITTNFEGLSNEEKDSIKVALSEHYCREIDISVSGLMMLKHEDIELISSTINGMILTKEQRQKDFDKYLKMDGTDMNMDDKPE